MDGFDNRVVKTYLNEYMGEFIFDPFQPFNFYNDKNVKYTMPHNGNREFYLGILAIFILLLISLTYKNMHTFIYFIYINIYRLYRLTTA